MLPGVEPSQLTARVCRMIVLFMAIFGIGLILLSEWLVTNVFGSQFSNSILVTHCLFLVPCWDGISADDSILYERASTMVLNRSGVCRAVCRLCCVNCYGS